MAPRAGEGMVFGSGGGRSCYENGPSLRAPIRPISSSFPLLLLLWGSSCLAPALLFVQLFIAPASALKSTATPPAMRILSTCSSRSHDRSTGRRPGSCWTFENLPRWTTPSEAGTKARRRNSFFAHRVMGPPRLFMATTAEEESRIFSEDAHLRSQSVEDIKSMKVAELRKECERRGLDKQGLKAELVARLSHHKKLSSSAKRMGHAGISDHENLREHGPVAAGGGNARDSTPNFNRMKVSELREQCKAFGLDGKGLKADLVERLEENASKSVSLSPSFSSNRDAEIEKTASEANSPSSFESLGLSGDIISAAIASQGWDTPTAVQSAVIPHMLLGSDYRPSRDGGPPSDDSSAVQIWQAPTGSGKTGAYALPLLQRLLARHGQVRRMSRREDSNDGGSWDGESSVRVTSLVLVPTRELALQIYSVLSDLVFALPPVQKLGGRSKGGTPSGRFNLNVRVIHGGSDVSVRDQLQELSDVGGGLIDVLVATPGRLLDVVRCQEDRARPDAALERRLLSALDAKRDAKANAPPKKKKKNKVWGQRRRRRVVGDDVSLNLSEVSEEELTRLLLAATDDDDEEEVNSSESFTMLRGVKFLILDEADKLLGKGFEEEMNGLMSYISFDATNELDEDRRQVPDESAGAPFEQQGGTDALEVHMFSATFPDKIRPRVQEIMRLCGKRTPVSPSVTRTAASAGGTTAAKAKRKTEFTESAPSLTSPRGETDPLGVKSPHSTITLRTIRLDRKDRTQALRHLIEEAQEFDGDGDCWDRILVFVSTRRSSEHVAKKLRKAGIRSTELHGKMDQTERVQTLEDFKRGRIRCLVATDLASRGLDVKGLPAVVNYDLPRSTSDFTHRIGRTGRAGLQGTAISFVTPENEAHFNLIEKRHFGGSMPAPREVLEGFEPDEESWRVIAAASRSTVPGVAHSQLGLPHDKMHGGIKGRRKSKKDKLREAAARQRAKEDPDLST